MKTQTYRLMYRRGGTENCTWHPVSTRYPSRESANEKADELVKMGYPCLIEDWDRSHALGLPTGLAARRA